MTTRILVAAVFLAGCAVGGVSSQLVVPKASAQQVATLAKWQVLCVPSEGGYADGEARRFTEAGNKAGAEHWELTSISDRMICFKRPKT